MKNKEQYFDDAATALVAQSVANSLLEMVRAADLSTEEACDKAYQVILCRMLQMFEAGKSVGVESAKRSRKPGDN